MLADRIDQLQSLRPDVVVLQECRQPTEADADVPWRRYSKYKGLAVKVTGAGWTGRAIPVPEGTPLGVLPMQVSGPVTLTVVGVWTLREPSYVAHFLTGMAALKRHLPDGPLVVLGDFNSTPKLNRDHRDLVRVLAEEYGLVSAYHLWHRVEHGQERHHTHYHRCRQASSWHIDFCFIPRAWADRLVRVDVGGYDEWPSSDHRPLAVELDLTPVSPLEGSR